MVKAHYKVKSSADLPPFSGWQALTTLIWKYIQQTWHPQFFLLRRTLYSSAVPCRLTFYAAMWLCFKESVPTPLLGKVLRKSCMQNTVTFIASAQWSRLARAPTDKLLFWREKTGAKWLVFKAPFQCSLFFERQLQSHTLQYSKIAIASGLSLRENCKMTLFL
jgi:hypothetical protein